MAIQHFGDAKRSAKHHNINAGRFSKCIVFATFVPNTVCVVNGLVNQLLLLDPFKNYYGIAVVNNF